MTTQLHLTPRLQKVANWVPQGSKLCDVGTDHAYLPAHLLLKGWIPSAIASDIRPGPLERAARTRSKYGLENQLDLRLCPGLEAVAPHEVETVSICGMGGEMISGILEKAPWTQTKTVLLLQPMRSQPELRRWLWEHGYCIEAEEIVREEQRWYTVMRVVGGQMEQPFSHAEALAGRPKDWVSNPQREGYLTYLLEKVQKQRRGVEQSSKRADDERRSLLAQTEAELTHWLDRLKIGGPL